MRTQLRIGTVLLGGGLAMAMVASWLQHTGEVVPPLFSISAFVLAIAGFATVSELASQACRVSDSEMPEPKRGVDATTRRSMDTKGNG